MAFTYKKNEMMNKMEKIDDKLNPKFKSATNAALNSQDSLIDLKKVLLTIENIVASMDINREIDLSILLEKYRDIEKKTNFPGVIVRLNKPKSTILIFSSGKLIITGVKEIHFLNVIADKIKTKLKNAGILLNKKPILKVVNIVCKIKMCCYINLDAASLVLNSSIYEPEVFPGLIYKVSKPSNMCFLLFTSGNIICTGSKILEHTKQATKKLAILLRKEQLLMKNQNSLKNELMQDEINFL